MQNETSNHSIIFISREFSILVAIVFKIPMTLFRQPRIRDNSDEDFSPETHAGSMTDSKQMTWIRHTLAK